MAYVTQYQPDAALVAQAANTAGTGMQQSYLNQQQVQKNQFGQDMGYRYAALGEQTRQADRSFNESVRQYDQGFEQQAALAAQDEAFRQQQAQTQNQQFRTQVGQNQFNQLLNAGLTMQQQQNQIAAAERMAVFEAEQRQKLIQQQAYLGVAASVAEKNATIQMQKQQQEADLMARQNYLQGMFSSGQLSASDYAQAKSQLDQQAMGIKSQDPTWGMSVEDAETYRDYTAQIKGREFERQLKATSNLSLDELKELGVIKIGDETIKVASKLELDNEIRIKELEAENKAKAEAAAKAQRDETYQRQQDEYNRKQQADMDAEFRKVKLDLMKEMDTTVDSKTGNKSSSARYTEDQVEAMARKIMGMPSVDGGASKVATQVFSGITGANTGSDANNPFAQFVQQGAPIGQSTGNYRDATNAFLGNNLNTIQNLNAGVGAQPAALRK